MSTCLASVPLEHRPALEKWIARAGLASVAKCLSWLAAYQLHHKPTGRLYGLNAVELFLLVQDLRAAL
jgi:hypothetical protein